jgi:hypothetical protein
MKPLIAISIAFILTCAVSTSAQTTQTNPSQTPAPPTATESSKSAALPKGTRFVGELKTKVDSKHVEEGQPIVLEVSKDVKSGDQLLLSKGSLVKGKITHAQAFSKGHSDAQLEIVLDSVVPKTGEQFSNHFAIFALAAHLEKQPDDINSSGGRQRLATSAGISGQVTAPSDLDLTPQSTGIFGFTGVELHPLVRMTPPTATVNSNTGNIVLDKGTKLVLESVGQ